jgi:hypothetical protein
MQALARRVANKKAGAQPTPSARRGQPAAAPAGDAGEAVDDGEGPETVPAGAGARAQRPPRPAGGSQRSQPRKSGGGRNRSRSGGKKRR